MACSNPFMRYNPISHSYDRIPCGWCIKCRIDKRTYFADRFEYSLYKEFKGVGSFSCVTYDDNHIPLNSKGIPTLRKSDSVNFIKRLRSHLRYHKINNDMLRQGFKFFCAGEYGSDFHRPHLHFIFCGLDFASVDKLFRACWKNGVIFDNRPILKGGITYVMKYIEKQQHGDELTVYSDLDIEPPYFHCSHSLAKGLYDTDEKFYLWHNKKRPLPSWIKRQRLFAPDSPVSDEVLIYSDKYNITYDDADRIIRSAKLNDVQKTMHFKNEVVPDVDPSTLQFLPKKLEFKYY